MCGTIDAKPNELPLSIGDGELAQTALTVVSVPEMFGYWLQGGRVTNPPSDRELVALRPFRTKGMVE